VITTAPFTVTAITPTPEPTPTTPEPTPEPTTPSPQPSETTAPAAAAASLSATSVLGGSGVTVTATGLAANEDVEIWIHSTPIQLWTGAADASGALPQAISIPTDIPLGAHQMEVRGATSGSLWLNLAVRGAELAATGADGNVGAGVGIGAATLLLGGAAVLLLVKHRRREAV
jgi:LPXTG-motif cell wall-anchored protein